MPEDFCIKVDDIQKMSPFNIPGPRHINTGELSCFISELSEKFNVDQEEIFIGQSGIPPSDPMCLIYLELSKHCDNVEVFFRKELKPDGRWINKNYMHHVKGSPGEEDTFDYRNGIAYI